MKTLTMWIVLGIAFGLTGCSDPSSSASSPTSGLMRDSYASRSSIGTGLGRYGYHPLPYDNTGNGPGETGMEGGGG